MRPREVASTLLKQADEDLPFAFRTAMVEDNAPRPVVSLTEWDRTDDRRHNTEVRGYVLDDRGDPKTEVKHRYYNMRLDFEIRASREENAYDALSMFEDFILSTNPREELHDHIRRLVWNGAGGIEPMDSLERSEASLTCSVTVRTFRELKDDAETFESFDWNLDVVESGSEKLE